MPNYAIGRSYTGRSQHGSVNRQATRNSEVEAETATYHGAMTVKPTFARQRADNWFIANLKALALFAKYDGLWVFANETEQAGRLNMVKRAHDVTIGVQPTWVANQGYTGNTTTMYLRTNYIPGTQGVAYSQNSAAIGVYCRTNVAVNGADMGANDGTNLFQVQARSGGGSTSFFVNQTASTSFIAGITDSRGWVVSNRRAAANVIGVKNGVETSAVAASTGINSRELFICCRNGSGTPGQFTNRQIALAKAGGGLTAAEGMAEFVVLERFLDSFGAGVM